MADPQPPGAPVTDAQGAALPQSLFDGRYHIVRVLGTGGFGRVFLAVDTRIGRDVALKELLADRRQDRATYDRYLERFQREARAGSSLRSENVVTVYDLHVDAAGNYYLALEYVEGQDLSELLAQVGVLPLERALAIVLDIARALDQVHEQDIVHRDIKPANILITVRGIAKLSDFGLAQVAHESQRSQIATRHPGTPVYMSPEQRVGFGYIDGRSDLYSLGLVLYEMLVGRRYGETGEPIARARPDLPPAVITIIDTLLQEDRDDRYQSARALISDLTLVATEPDTPAASLPSFQIAAPPAPPAPPVAAAPVAAPRMPPPGMAPPPAMPPIMPAPPAASPARRTGLIALIAVGAAAVLIAITVLTLVLLQGQRHSSAIAPEAAPIATVATTPTVIPPTPALPTAVSSATALPTPPEVKAPTATVARPLPGSGAGPSASTAPSGGAGGARPIIEPPTATPEPGRRVNPSQTSPAEPGHAANDTTWEDPHLVLLLHPPDWKEGVDAASRGNVLMLQGPNDVIFYVDIFPARTESIEDLTQLAHATHTQDTKLLFTDDADTATVIGGENARTFTFHFVPRDRPNLPPNAGQIWFVIHGGMIYRFSAIAPGAFDAAIEPILNSIAFLS